MTSAPGRGRACPAVATTPHVFLRTASSPAPGASPTAHRQRRGPAAGSPSGWMSAQWTAVSEAPASTRRVSRWGARLRSDGPSHINTKLMTTPITPGLRWTAEMSAALSGSQTGRTWPPSWCPAMRLSRFREGAAGAWWLRCSCLDGPLPGRRPADSACPDVGQAVGNEC